MRLSESSTQLSPTPSLPSAAGAALAPGVVPDTVPTEALVRGMRGLVPFARTGVIALSECPMRGPGAATLNGLGELVQVVT